jgi:hypothetical protein
LTFLLAFLCTAVVVLLASAPCYAADPNFDWSCNYNQDNDRIDIVVSTNYGPLEGSSVVVRWQDVDANGAWTELVSSGFSVHSPISKFFVPSGAQNGKRYMIAADFYKGGSLAEAKSQLIIWGDPTSGTGTPANIPVEPEYKPKGGPFVRMIASVVDAVNDCAKWAAGSLLGSRSMGTLIFNQNLSDSEKQTAPFTAAEMDRIWAWYKGIAGGAMMLVLIAVAVTAFKFTSAPFNVSLREDAVASMWRWLWAVVFIACAPIFFYAMIQINNAMIDTLLSVAGNAGQGAGLEVLLDPNVVPKTGYVLADSVVALVFTFIRLWLAVMYALRRLVLLVILIFTPIMAWLWAINKNVNAAPIWFGEILSNIFMQSAHAFTFLVLMSFITTAIGNNAGVSGITGNAGALGQALLDLLSSYGVPLGGALLLASVIWTAVQIITSRFRPGKKEGVIDNLTYVGVGGIMLGGLLFFASLVLGVAQTYFPSVFVR